MLGLKGTLICADFWADFNRLNEIKVPVEMLDLIYKLKFGALRNDVAGIIPSVK